MSKINTFLSMNKLLYISLFFILKSFTYSQTGIEESFQFKLSNFLNDSGKGWRTISHFNHSNDYKNLTDESIENTIKKTISFRSSNKNFSLLSFNQGSFKNFFAYSYLFLGRKGHSFKLNHEINEHIHKSSINQFKILFSGIGYKNDWVILKISRGSESWGAGENINLALSESSFPYDYLTLGSNYGKLRVKYIHGFLEKTSSRVNRFLIGKGIEYTNEKSFIIGFSEIIIYSGLNRPLDIAYLNPVSSHVEVELNNRLNITGDSNSNAVWQMHIDAIFKEKIRISMNILIDEFVFDPDLEIGKEHGRAFSLRLSYNILDNADNIFNLYSKYIHVGTPTFRHGIGTNNFINNNFPLGWSKGSDSEEISVGFNYSNKNSIIWILSTGTNLSGDENILLRSFDPYTDYQKSYFPSGKISKILFLNSSIDWDLNKYFTVMSILNLTFNKKNKILLGINFSIPI